MSAINEWFGYYNAIYTYIDRTYGTEELNRYFRYLARETYSDVTPGYRAGGLEAIRDRYMKNFIHDGDEYSVQAQIADSVLTMEILCPAYTHGVEVKHPDRQVGMFLCQCCEKLNKAVLEEAGYALDLQMKGCGRCRWRIFESDLSQADAATAGGT